MNCVSITLLCAGLLAGSAAAFAPEDTLPDARGWGVQAEIRSVPDKPPLLSRDLILAAMVEWNETRLADPQAFRAGPGPVWRNILDSEN